MSFARIRSKTSVPDFFLYLMLKKNKDTMKRSTLLFAAIVLFAFASCTEDETIEELVYIQDTIESDMSFSGEEGYDGTDDEKDQ